MLEQTGIDLADMVKGLVVKVEDKRDVVSVLGTLRDVVERLEGCLPEEEDMDRI